MVERLSNVTPRICWWKLLSFYCQKEFSNFVSLPSYFCNNKKHISNISRQIVLGWTLHQLKDFSWICVYGLPHTQLMLFMSQVFFLQEILLIAEIIIIATRCLIRWEWQNFHRPYSRKNFRRLSSHKKRHTNLHLTSCWKQKFMNILDKTHTQYSFIKFLFIIAMLTNWILIIS